MGNQTYTLNFPNGNSQSYPDYNSMCQAARAMGGEAKNVNMSARIYAFVPKK